jgi:hypothetical protein
MALRLDIQKDGLTYCIDMTSVEEVRQEALLSQDAEGWHLQDVAGDWVVSIGRRKSWARRWPRRST